ncbi:T9SS type A sorting domain-containing protein [Hymenobacter jejuensis]|uniref:T9SS type A sorting domain-containing protein n=1 Tax=Hymenobacter jejuensis TaxID=2502781 RepID=A0A5B7ZVK3_9BACT|nr:T9SS type A sorting domain-containing protein [Hymenobacter jejuensis]QDA58605.1 T9SS type A sorting domain-containing protein [Hymenobacter jejuensis]
MRTLLPSKSRCIPWGSRLAKVLLPAVTFLATTGTALAQFPRYESFKNTTTTGSGFILGGPTTTNKATLTAASGVDADGAGYLRLTNNTGNQAGYAIDNASFPAPSGFSISFEFFSYGGTGADGFSVFFIDADKTSAAAFTSGASGGSLGYAQKTADPVSNGVPNGYIGIGIDEYGNYTNPTEGRVGGPGPVADAVAIRGAGNGRSATDYPYIAGSGTLPFSVDVATTRANVPTNADYRRAYIDVVPQISGGVTTYSIRVRIQHGSVVTTAINGVTVPTPPNNLRIGFAGSTGGSTNYHEIRNLAIVKAPIANDDVATTRYNAATTIDVINNDIFSGSNYQTGSVDLDPFTAGIQSTFAVANQGTFSVDAQGLVTFTPSGTYAGVVTIPYIMQDVAGANPVSPNPQVYSNPGNISVTVTGADLLTTVSAPATAASGANFVYTVTTKNSGPETATNVVPTLTLSTKPIAANVILPTGAAYDATSGKVTFATTGSLAPDGTVTNTVTVKAPTSGAIVGTAATTNSIPDPDATNNTASVTTVVTGPDLVVTFNPVPPTSVAVGTLINYAFTIRNTGSVTATNVAPTLTLSTKPAAADVTNLPAGASYNATTGVVTFASNSITTATPRSYTVTVKAPASPTLVATATGTGTEADITPANNTVSATTSITGADIVTTVSGPATTTVGTRITYTMTTTNTGTQAATNVVPTLTLAPNLPAGSVTVTGGTYDQPSGIVTFTTITNMAANGPAKTNTVTFTVPATAAIAGTATSTGDGFDPNTDNNTVSITTTVSGADVATTLSGPTTATPGSKVVYTMSTTNAGTLAATNVVPTLTLAPNLPAGSVTNLPTGAIYDPASGKITFATITSLGANAAAVTNSVTLTVPTTGASLKGTATSTGSDFDPNTANNSASLTTNIIGADVVTGISGPTTANPSSNVSYTVSTTNLGTETATSIVPTLTLSTKPAAVDVILPTGASYDPTSGKVTFATITSLAANAAAVTNVVTVKAPASGTLIASAASTGTSFDPNTANNTADLTTTISGVANIATACATPGKDGVGTLNGTSPNTYYPGVSTAVANGTSTVTIGAARTGTGTASTAVAAGDLVLVMQMQGADITTTNTTTYGTVTNNTNYTAGKYEYAIVTSVATAGSNQVLTLAKTLTNAYTTAAATGTAGQRTFQVIRIPQYSSLTLSGTVTGAAWNGTTGGVLAVDVAGKTTYATGASLSMTAKGFRGGGGVAALTATTGAYVSLSAAGNGSKGEGSAGTPTQFYDGTSVSTTGSGYPVGSHAAGAPGNAGGGATDLTATNTGNAGGGGGTNGGAGGVGGFGFDNTGNAGSGIQAQGGRSLSADASASRLFMGGGGGAGSIDAGTTAQIAASSGGVGGGIVILRSGQIVASGTGTLTVQADGANAPTAGATVNATTNLQGAGGGGAGGTVLVMASLPDGSAASLTNVTISADGGSGGNAGYTDNGRTGTNRVWSGYGPGGGGGGGKYYTNGTVATSTVAAGNAGTTRNGLGNSAATTTYGAANGATGTSLTTATPSSTATIAGAGSCMPVLTTSLATSTPQVNKTSTSVSPASYVLSVSNTGGVASGVTATTRLDDLFNFDNTFTPVVKLTDANGNATTLAAGTDYTVDASVGISPVFKNITIPGGSTLSISFRATIKNTATSGTSYDASTTIAYTDPTRTPTSSVITPGGTYAATGTVPGTNYDGTTSANSSEDVTVVRALPVELKQFVATAIRLDALLTWSTATERNNDRFEIERSLDGKTFEKIGSVKGQGNSTHATEYRYTDTNAARWSAKPIYYRLRQVDFDGVSAFSPVRFVTFDKQVLTAVALYPNPAHGAATLDLTGLAAGTYQVQVLDLTGRVLSKQTVVGAQAHPLSVQQLPMGSYIVRIQGAGTNVTLPLVRN